MPRIAAQQEYEDRLRRREAELARLGRRDRGLGNARVAAVALALAAVWPTLIRQSWSLWWLVAPAAAFVALAAAHGPVVGAIGRLRVGAAFYRRGLSRMAGEWGDPLDDGARFRSEEHPYAEDLDVFGAGSLYALLCTARSLPGRETLAAWLAAPAAPEVVVARQEGAAELRGRLELQEDVAVFAAGLSPEIRVEKLDRWAAGERLLAGRAVPVLAAVLGAVNLAAVGAWLSGALAGSTLLPVLAAGGLLGLALRSRVAKALGRLEWPAGELRFLARALSRFEEESFASPLLRDLQRRAGDAAVRPSARLIELARLVEWNDSRANVLFQLLAALLLLGTQLAFAAERWRARHGAAAGDWLRVIGELEALSALATLAYENPDFVFPELVAGPPRFAAADLAHPLLPRGDRVANSVELGGDAPPGDAPPGDSPLGGAAGGPLRLLLVSGSNMSGKSTLLRTVGVAAVLAQAGAPVPARWLRLTPLAVGASIRLHDSLRQGVSRFYAELRRLRQVRELADAGPTLFLLDEILHGTNSHDRRLGAAGVIRGLLDAGAIGLVTTHDLALAEVAEELAPAAGNVHFEDHLEAGRMAFDYRLRPGVVERGNALALMRSLGLAVEE